MIHRSGADQNNGMRGKAGRTKKTKIRGKLLVSGQLTKRAKLGRKVPMGGVEYLRGAVSSFLPARLLREFRESCLPEGLIAFSLLQMPSCEIVLAVSDSCLRVREYVFYVFFSDFRKT